MDAKNSKPRFDTPFADDHAHHNRINIQRFLRTASLPNFPCPSSRKGVLVLMEAATGKEVSRLAYQDRVIAVAFSPDGKCVATGSLDSTARVMEAATGREMLRLAHQGFVNAVAFSPDGRWVATGSWDNTARVMEAATGKEVSRLAHQRRVFAVAFSPDRKWVTTGSEDNTARVMEAATGKELVRHQLNGPITAVSFLGNSSLVVDAQTSSNGIEISHIIIDPTELIRDDCSRLPRNLTREEWERYLPGEPYRATCPNLPLEPRVP